MSAASSSRTWEYFNVSQPSEYVTHVEINRPNRLNAWIEPMWLELARVFDHISHDPSTRAVVFSGAGPRAFTSGLDVQAASSSGPLTDGAVYRARKALALRRHVAEFQSSISSLARCEKPVVAVLHGYSFGLAIDLSSAADVRFCAADTKFAVKEVDIGLAADIGTLQRLPKVVGNQSWVKDVCLSARIFGAEEALAQGFVSKVCGSKEDAIKAALTWAALVAEKSPVAVQGTKNVLDYSRDHSVEDGLRYVGLWNAAALQTGDVKEAMSAGMKKTKPRFEKL